MKLTSFGILLGAWLDGAVVCLLKGLRRKTSASRPKATVIHGMLEGIILPTKDVIPVLRKARPTSFC